MFAGALGAAVPFVGSEVCGASTVVSPEVSTGVASEVAAAGAEAAEGEEGVDATGSTLSTMRTPLGFLSDALRCSLALISASDGRSNDVVG